MSRGCTKARMTRMPSSSAALSSMMFMMKGRSSSTVTTSDENLHPRQLSPRAASMVANDDARVLVKTGTLKCLRATPMPRATVGCRDACCY